MAEPLSAAGPASAAARTASIEVKDLVVRYGKVLAVRGVSLSVGAGEHLTLLGPSGCGKTTTLRAIAGLEKPESGEIRIDGAVVYSSSPRVQVPPEKRGLSIELVPGQSGQQLNTVEGAIYFIDPMGNIMMRYKPTANPSKIFKDLSKLLRVSQIG
jgi:ABC-type dipeptide/oligopeptide/nickel transport system ATPase subunit